MNKNENRLEQNDYYPFGMKHDNANLVSSGNRYRFVGAEMQVIGIVGDIDLGARNYDPFTGRTRTQDRFSEKYYGLSQYGYAANSPTNIIDINGDSISLAAIQRIDATMSTSYTQAIVNDLRSQTGLDLSVSPNGQLTYAKDNTGNPVISTTTDAEGNTIQAGSQTARDLIVNAINHQDVVTVVQSSTSGVKPGTDELRLGLTQISNLITGSVGVDNRTMGFGMTLMHELHHTQVGGGLSDAPYNPGPVVTQMNKIRGELNSQGGNYGRRLSYKGIMPTGSSKFYVPFDYSSKVLMNMGIAPFNGKYIKF